ncbi:16S rRNA (guanine(527)-N(7))-methyltransferase RsmG [Asticcacaulis sp. ZE23SCel15]|uniref:16S rRNA (guanine(527)-N(7))-methyltransferase RsmG n=1 Tax=Asticcacaulis sp. ZE23SCel15 TaxID=3059027 RepID=UPI00265EB144|nr:16S rRNA (guanine(527)-N(7))-methyltransferase RsmG [Asticcacaulis sp. ZE23SCel15]WKL58292.1 16S rRNA (guanine(527)-N(7))-methyltransferase RsmG [Asticcacaulis sp. ZE23SCel15]
MTPEQMASHLVFHVKHEAIADLSRFQQVLADKNEVMNLVGPTTVPHYWSRHVLDSAQLLNHAPEAKIWADLGAGAGFPGVVLAILLKHAEPSDITPHVYLIDSLTKRCLFLSEVVTSLDLPATVINDRAENIKLKVDVVTARAMAPLPKLLGFAEGFFKRGAQGWFLKGENVDSELMEAEKAWQFASNKYSSLSDPRGRVVHIRSLKHVR